ncbi:MAG: TonB-dependent receptor [Phenylobacterium sp.]|uniref:TonB-dependent receptor n=1 Tax=Phenylobacterium sp. TaxID=1871053 RepID=UPI001A5488A8|nr:TonB-dependent receptor [Phenylobacterium sp.]MBL8772760.1 TonB-dependent receptor [Phenylobacterium sp.]
MTRSTALRALLAAGASAATLAFAVTAAAADDVTDVGEVIVTAQKKAENINEVPLSVTAVSGQKLDAIRSSGGDIRVFSARVPSLTLESSFGRTFPRPYIRGLGNTDFDLNASQPVSFVYDEVVLETPVLKGFPLFDIDQVEVLRGPQGTLFGRNTPAGVLKFDSAKPSQTFGGYASASYATFSTINLEGAVGGPIIPDVLAFRLSGLYQHRDDWVDNTRVPGDNDSEGYNQYAFRGQLLWTPNESLSALLNLHYQHLNGTPRVFRANIIQRGTNNFVPGFDRDTISQDAQSRAIQKVQSSGASLKVAYDFGEGMPELTSITAYEMVDTYSRGDIDGGFGAAFAPPSGPGVIPFPSESADGVPFHRQFSQEFRLAGDSGPLGYTVGFYYFNESIKIDSYSFNTLAGGAIDGFAYQNQKTESWALFANLDYEVSDQLTVGGGIRYSDDDKDFLAQRTRSPFGAPPTAILRTSPDASEVSFNLNASYAVNDDLNLYGRIARGYRAPSVQGRLVFGDTLSVADKETVMSYEAGLKGRAGGRIRYDASVFYYRANDLQVTAVGGGANFNRLLNADKATGYGFEFNAEAEPVDRLLITAGLSYNNTEIDDPALFTQPCGAPCTVLDPAGPIAGTVRIDGNSLPNAPKWIANITAGYSWPMGEGEIFVFTDWAYRSKINFFLYQSVEFTDDKLLEGGVRLGYRAPGGMWEAALFGRNITNDRSLEGGIDFNNLTGFVNDPRILGAEVKAKF